jgi:hypothetical protein
VPVVRDGTVLLSGNVLVKPADAIQSASYHRSLFALDANTGQERWRYSPASSANTGGFCVTQPIVTADTFFAVASATLYAVNLATGRERWKPLEVRRPVDGGPRGGGVRPGRCGFRSRRPHQGRPDRVRQGLGPDRVGYSGQYRENSPSTAVAGQVLYFQATRARAR